MFPEVDPVLGPEMRSTGEVLGLAYTAGEAFFKAEEGASSSLPLEGCVLLTLSDRDKKDAVPLGRLFSEAGFSLMATKGTYALLHEAGIKAECVAKLKEGSPDISDHIAEGRVQLLINTPIGRESGIDDSYLRKAAIKARIAYITTTAAAYAAAEGIRQIRENRANGIRSAVNSLQEWHSKIN